MIDINAKIEKLLNNQGGNYILPFFWQHGEDEETLRHYMEVIANCGIGAVCVESRPHPDFCGPKWWADMDAILDEAKKRDMKVWILDDAHFPTGYANGALEGAPINLRRQSATYHVPEIVKSGETVNLKRDDYKTAKPFEKSYIEQHVFKDDLETFDDDVLLGIAAVKVGGSSRKDIIELSGEDITFTAQGGEWSIYILHLTRNRGPHRNYINMLSRESCAKLIEAVYEPHFDRYKDDFGKTIAGFFSDEPELGNGHLYETGKTLDEVDDQPWSEAVQQELQKRWGDEWYLYLPLIWDKTFCKNMCAKIRYDYMDIVTRHVEKDFSYQLGDWCRERGVEYIGHLIEDNNQHSRNGSSLGHYFRGLAGQDMAGIDNIGGQVLPQGEEIEMLTSTGNQRDGTFFHYSLGKLAASAAAIEPLKKGRAMCENFGNYGWQGGVRLMKYLAEHFMVRGVNYYVPHAFSPKAFPDPDCPPHFYAHGHNPQYRHFGYLTRYMNRVCELISDGKHIAPVAILYHGEADWAGGTCMFSQDPAKKLADRQIDYDIIPSDVFAEEKYGTVTGETLKINTQEYKILIVPEASFVTAELARAAAKLSQKGCPVVFINKLPTGVCNGDNALLDGLKSCTVVPLDDIVNYLDKLNIAEISLSPANNQIRYIRYQNGNDMYYFLNEGAEDYNGTITLPSLGQCYAYNAWDNVLEAVSSHEADGKTHLTVCLEPSKGFIVIFDTPDRVLKDPVKLRGKSISLNDGWSRSVCQSKEYPTFYGSKGVSLPDKLEDEDPKFAGFVRYEKNVELSSAKKTILEITDAAEGVEVFVNDVSADIQIVPKFVYDITGLLKDGTNNIAIEVATTLDRAVERQRRSLQMPVYVPTGKCGICGTVNIWTE